jgi:16S rRNA (cytidine1402-2'-O)-methyltransferase
MSHSKTRIYLIPTFLDEEAIHTIPSYVVDAVKDCRVFFVENERTARRYLKKLGKEIVIDDYEWFGVDGNDEAFRQKIKEGKNIGIISEAGCPGIADPGQVLIAIAHEMKAEIKPLVGPSSILLALMASGMNGQQFQFAGYLPIKDPERTKAINELEAESRKKNCTQVFIETPYRNNQLVESLIKTCRPSTKLCIAVNLTSEKESIHTMTIEQWKKARPDLHKQPAIFLLFSGS